METNKKEMAIVSTDLVHRALESPYTVPAYNNHGEYIGYYTIPREYFNRGIFLNDIARRPYLYMNCDEFHPWLLRNNLSIEEIWLNKTIKLYAPKWMVDTFGEEFTKPLIIYILTKDFVCDVFRQFIGLNYPPIAKPPKLSSKELLSAVKDSTDYGWKWIDKNDNQYTTTMAARTISGYDMSFGFQNYPSQLYPRDRFPFYIG